VRGGQLFVTGRRKDVIIIRGRNYYPEDIEHSISRAHPALRVGYCVAFSVEIENRERLVVIQEIEPRHRDLNVDEALRVIRQVIASQHELEVYDVVLAKAGEISKTSSGKTQRSACRERYLDDLLQIVARWQVTDDLPGDEVAATEALPSPRIVSAEEIEDWLIRRIASVLRLPEQQIQVGTPFLEFGMSSLDAVQMAEDLERWLGRRMSPTAIYNYPNIAALSRWLADSGSTGKAISDAAEPRGMLENTNPDSFEDVRNMTEADMKAFILEEMAKQ
jgi:acyl carrier protein